MTKKIITILGWVIIFQLIGYGLGQITDVNMTTWYATLHKSSLTPQGIVFAIVWPILYIMIAISGYSLWENRAHPIAKLALGFYSAQMILNWAWSLLFFKFHLITVSFYCVIFIAILTLITIVLTKKRFKLSSIMLIPYFIWLLFASYLNGVIWMFN